VANPSKQRPWVMQMYAADLHKWFDLGAYSDKDTAEAMAILADKRDPETPHRAIRWEWSAEA
jgi:hypothetical protein